MSTVSSPTPLASPAPLTLESEVLVPDVAVSGEVLAPAVSHEVWDFSPLYGLIDAGGPVIMVLAVMSLISMSVFLMKVFQFMRYGYSRQGPLISALTFWGHRDVSSALGQLNKTRNPIARVLEVAMSLRSQKGNDDTLVREEVMRIAKRQLAKAKSHLRILEVIATLSPLLGLLGTVLGMITAFQKLQGAGAAVDPSILSGGIWEALLTTAAGLIVAIPTVLGLNWLEQKVERFKLTLEDCMTQVFTVSLFTHHEEESSPEVLAANVFASRNKGATKTAANSIEEADNKTAHEDALAR